MFDYFIFDEITSIKGFIVKGFFSGLFMSSFLVSMHLHKLNQMGITDIPTEVLNPKQSKFIPSLFSMNEVINLLKHSDYNLTGNIITDKNETEIILKISFKSNGEKITILPGVKNNIKGFNIQSKPIFPLTYGDLGRGIIHILRLEKLLQKGLLCE